MAVKRLLVQQIMFEEDGAPASWGVITHRTSMEAPAPERGEFFFSSFRTVQFSREGRLLDRPRIGVLNIVLGAEDLPIGWGVAG